MNELHPAADHCSGITSREDKMSKEAITKVVQRAISDAGFRRQLSTDPTGALRGFDLSADEAAALRTGDAGRLSALGVDQRMSKAFALGGAAAAATRPGSTDLNASGLSAGGANALSNADATGAAGSMRSALVSSSDANSALIDDGAAGARTIIPTEPHGSLAADLDGGAAAMAGANADDSSEAYLSKVGYDSSAAQNADASGGASARASAINDDPDGFLTANKNADFSGSARAINDDPDGFLAANKNADFSGGTAGDGTAFLDESEAYLTRVGYDANAATSAVTDAHDRGDGGVSAVTDAHDRGDVTRVADDADSAGSSAASEGGPNISS
jgi:hypothetical protein